MKRIRGNNVSTPKQTMRGIRRSNVESDIKRGNLDMEMGNARFM